MVQPLPFIPDAFPEPVVYAPDFNFFDKMLQRKQAQYEQGVSQAKAAYRSVYDAPLTNQYNIPLKDQYLKQAQEGLKKIAATDLSLPQNQQIAQSLYAPFWEDKFIVQDAGLTKWYQSQAQKLDDWRTSSDPKIREQYNGIVTKYLSNGLDVLRTAKRDGVSFSQIEKREAIPWTNIESYLEKAANDARLTIKKDDPSGPYLVSIENGERSKQKYTVWAQSMLGNNFYQQFNVSGIVEKEERIKNIKKNPDFLRRYPNATDKDVLSFMSEDVITELNYGYNKRKEETNVELARVNSLIDSMPDVLDDQHEKMLEALVEERRNLNSRLAGINEEYKNFDQPDKDLIKSNLLINPDSYFATLAKQRVINNWATGRASIEQQTIKENTAWSSAENLQMRKAEYEITRQKTIWDHEQNLWEREHPKSTGAATIRTKTIKDANGNDVTVIDESPYGDEESTGSYIGLGTTDITKGANTGVALDIFNKNQKELFTNSYDMLFNTNGLLALTKIAFSDITQQDISNIHSYFKREMRSNVFDPNGDDVTQTPEEARSMNKIVDKLITNDAVKSVGYTKKEQITGPGSFANVLGAFGADYLTKRNKGISDGTEPPLTKEELAAQLSYDQAHMNLETYTANEENRKKLFKDKILNNANYKRLVKNEKLVTISDIENDIIKNYGNIEIELTNKKGNTIVKTSRDIAQSFFNGDFNFDPTSGKFNSSIYNEGNPTKIKVNGKDVELSSSSPLKSSYWLNSQNVNFWVNPIYNILNKQYGASKEFSNLMKKAENEIVPNLLYYQSQTGKMGVKWAYNFSKKKENDKAYTLFNTALSQSNSMIYDADLKDPLEPEKMQKIRDIFENKEKNVEDHIGGFTYKTLTAKDGKPAIEFSIAKTANDKDPVNEIAGTYHLLIEDSNNLLGVLPQNTGQYMYGSLLRGKTITSNPIMSASGFKYTITPSITNDRDLTSEKNAHVRLDYMIRENKQDANGVITSTLVPKTFEETFSLTTGENRKNPDELVNYLNSLYQKVMLDNQQAKDAYQLYLKSKLTNPTTASGTPVRTITKAEKMKQLERTTN